MRTFLTLVSVALLSACGSVSTPPPPAQLPSYAFSSLRDSAVTVVAVDERTGEPREAWQGRLDSDVRDALQKAGVQVVSDAPTRLEFHLLRARSDIEYRHWKGCVEISGKVVGPKNVEAVGDACVTRANFWGKKSADHVLRLAYQDALSKVLSALDAQL
jgi:hypothetical protein